MADERRTLTIRFEPAGEQIAGTIGAEGEEFGFWGWIELASLIDRLRTSGPEGGPDAAVSPRPGRPGEPRGAPAGS